MSGWGSDLDDLAGAIAQLLVTGPSQVEPLTHVANTLAARNVVLAEVRSLAQTITETQLVPVQPIGVRDLARQPATTFAVALRHLPSAPGAAQGIGAPIAGASTPLDQGWRTAAQAAVVLEAYAGALGQLPEDVAWKVLRDLSDISAALPPLDLELAHALRPEHPARPVLTDPDTHGVLRVTVAELQFRIDRHLAVALPGDPQLQSTRGAPSISPPAGVLDAPKVTAQLADVLRHRSSGITVEEARAALRLLTGGLSHVAVILERPRHGPHEWRQTADALRSAVPSIDRLRRSDAHTLAPASFGVLTATRDVNRQLEALAGLAQRLDPAATPAEWLRLVEPALAWAATTPAVTAAVRASLTDAVRVGAVLVLPSVVDSQRASPRWETAQLGRGAGAELVSRAEVAASALSAALAGRPASGTAATAARHRAGQARQELRAVLSQGPARSGESGITALSAHPRDERGRRPQGR